MMAHPTIGPLTTGARNAFPQTGSWSMVDIAKLPVEATIGVLSRYAAGRVNPYTVLVSQALCGQFQLTAKGRANIKEAVDSLSSVGAAGSALEFGFGVEDLIRSMTKSEQGTISLALCAALMEVYLPDVATEVLLEMARLSNVGGEWMPSSREWKAILNACSGVLSTTAFGSRAEGFMQLWPEEQRLGAFQRLEAEPRKLRKCSAPKSIAEALIAISAISRGDLQAITLMGGPDMGWLAAVADWILSFTISIFDARGDLLFTNTNDPESVQVRFIFLQGEADQNRGIALSGKTYILEDISQVLSDETTGTIGSTVSGRVKWENALRTTFLADFANLLLSMPETLGTLLGCAGRMFKAIAQADKSIPSTYLTACTTYCDQSFGPGFITNVLHWFPELAKLRPHMEKAVMLSLKDARGDYEASIARLRQTCSCQACQSPSNGFDFDNEVEMTPAPDMDDEEQAQSANDEIAESTSSGDSDSQNDWDPDRYCAVIMAETIIVLSRALANVSLDDPRLSPMRSGFELAYGRQLTMRRCARSGATAISELGQLAFCMDFDANFSFGMRENDYGTGIRLSLILELFSGERPHLSHGGVSAACSKGLCAYFRGLRDGSFAECSAGSISIIPGRIQYEKKNYTALEDRHAVQTQDFHDTIALLFRTGADFGTLEFSARESSTALQCLMQLRRTPTELTPVSVGPANFVDFLAARRGLVPCGQRSRGRIKCRKLKELTSAERHALNTQETQAVHLVKDWIKAKGVYFFRLPEHQTARAIMAHCADQYMYTGSIFIVDQECIDCCVRIASRIERDDDLYFFYLPAS